MTAKVEAGRLLPCPFCGGAVGVAVSQPTSRWAGFWVRCYADRGGCGAQGPQKREALAAIAAWNLRDVDIYAAERMSSHE